jgi:hypothetical protein
LGVGRLLGEKVARGAEEDVRGVRDVLREVGQGADVRVLVLDAASQERTHRQAAVLQLLDLELLQVVLLGKVQGVEAPAGV